MVPGVGDVHGVVVESHSLRIIQRSIRSIDESCGSASNDSIDSRIRCSFESGDKHPVISAVSYRDPAAFDQYLARMAGLLIGSRWLVRRKMQRRIVQNTARPRGLDHPVYEREEHLSGELSRMRSDYIPCRIDRNDCRPR